MEQQRKEVKINIRASDAALAGTYANNLMLHMNREEFVLDFINMVPPNATLNARVVVSPSNLKRMIEIVKESLARYEREFGTLPSPSNQPITTKFVQ